MAFKEVSLPKAHDFKDNPEVEGTLVEKMEHVGENDSNYYVLEHEVGGDKFGMWGSTVLDTQMKWVKPGDKIQVTFMGMENSTKRKGATFKNFKVAIWQDD